MEELNTSLHQYKEQLAVVNQALENVSDDTERESLVTLQCDLNQLIQLTQENLDSLENGRKEEQKEDKKELDDEYALFMAEMAKSGAYEPDSQQELSGSKNEQLTDNNDEETDIEDELTTLLGMKCAVYHTHKWGGQPTLHNAMVSAVMPRQDDDQFKDLQVRVLFTHPTHTEMLPCPFYLEGECRFDDEQCRYSHGAVTHLSNLKEAIEPSFDALKPGSRVLMKLKPPDDEDVSLTKKSTEKYHLWHRGVVKSLDLKCNTCSVKLEHGMKSGEKRKAGADEHIVRIEDIFPLNDDDDSDSSSDDSLSDTEYPEVKSIKREAINRALLVERSLENNTPAMGEWERHTRGIGSKLMLSMGYVPGTGLGAASDGRVMPVEARVLPTGKSLDQCMAISEKYGQDSLKVEQRLKRLQKKEEERNKRAYEREKEKERRNVFNFLNKTLGDTEQEPTSTATPSLDVKQSSSKDLNIEQFKITEDTRKLERELAKLNSSLARYPPSSSGHTSLAVQIADKNKELSSLRRREQQISREQKQRKDKEKMTIF